MAAQATDSTKTLLDYGLEIPSGQNLLHLRPPCNSETESFNMGKVMEKVEKLEVDLMRKEMETVNVLNQLEATRKFVQGLKADLMAGSSSSPSNSLMDHPVFCTGSMIGELMRTQSSFNRASLALAIIQASLESLNKKMRLDEEFKQGENRELIMAVNMESEELKKMKDASRYEVKKAIREIERTKNSILIAEMRLNAAKKLDEAVKAVEAIGAAERRCVLSPLETPEGVIKFVDKSIVGASDENKSEAKTVLQESDKSIYLHRQTHGENGPQTSKNKHKKSSKESRGISIGAILTRKLITSQGQDDDELMKKPFLKEPHKLILKEK